MYNQLSEIGWSELCKQLCETANWAKAKTNGLALHSWPDVVLFCSPLVWVRLVVAFVVKHIRGNVMDLDTRGMVEHLEILKNCLTDLIQVLQMHRQQIDAVTILSGFPLVNKRTSSSETCLEFWFSILVLTSGCSVKSGAKYSKYSAENTNGEPLWSLKSSYNSD